MTERDAEEPWLTIIGIGDNGLASLTPQAQALLWQAETIVLGERLDTVLEGGHLPGLKRILTWSAGFRQTLGEVLKLRGTPVTILATGDPMHFGIGATLRRYVAAEEMLILPSPSAFSLAAARLSWPLQSVVQISLHGRPLTHLNRHLLPRARILALTSDASTVTAAAALLVKRGFGASVLTVLEHMGGEAERITAMTAQQFLENEPPISDFNTLAIDCASESPLFSPVPGLPDEAFRHDGQLTKREIRAVTLSQLSPFPDALLWDVGAGCGSIAIEWMRAGMGTRAIAIESKAERAAMIRANADALGVPDLEIIEDVAPEGLEGLEPPDVVFIGGGITNEGVFEACWEALAPGGQLVANVVTIEGEARLADLRGAFGGELIRLSVARAAPVGRYCGWKSLMPVTIWSVTKGETA
ncbi:MULTISPECIES: precorrin-6y C5,15-methyltransferase (decarboxylating) subunit CbiE [Alphaproteobacteria]|uniref:Precorrin-6Y C5,15-methyltransferase (Decarboxylating) n=2 Tax=Alphaproteobacteria TaxID=28211 RepID=A0A512HHT3_9HYPH|nr:MULTISPECIES: precorrin-6y C5,15-methyltransferase (decarboxylating) subunit CbiE [Alphaproteobacteria]GEO85008.1 precorrin-6Y C5,15-methyltransferase (decarboxylating) [Ciceribacter naphthalenivorans]GLR22942.1 precorrin-6Y C5,15-methyltransferase (decarboxylating) [Ciceribacter naphthalenivorans]GLT05798.1 precorrin-6Y C5,15-methyltransferase (decarboxylating) [Sphingomonas psychrolutea]